jgi:hypothetical protein
MAYLVRSLVDLRNEIDARWPGRSRNIDGWYRAVGVGMKSEHWPDAKGAVHAIDVTVAGIDPWVLIEAGRVTPQACWYMIYSRHLYSHNHGWIATPIVSDGPHLDHVHVSGWLTAAAENYHLGWGLVRGSSGPVGPVIQVPTQNADSWDYSGAVADARNHADLLGRYVSDMTGAVVALRR